MKWYEVTLVSTHEGADLFADALFSVGCSGVSIYDKQDIVALYDSPQLLPLPEMYGKNLTFKTGGVDGCDCVEILSLIAQGNLDTTPLITHTYPLRDIEAAYTLFEEKRDGVIKVAIEP